MPRPSCGPRTVGSTTSTDRASCWPATSTGPRSPTSSGRSVSRTSASSGSGACTVLQVTTDGDTTVPDVLERVDRELGLGKATPDHILFVTPGGGYACPATEPEEPGRIPRRTPASPSDLGAGTEVFVSVVDTGWWPPRGDRPRHPVARRGDGDPETIDLNNIHPYAGHGTFIAGVVRSQAPAAEIRVEGFLPLGGAVYESEIVVQLGEALALAPRHHLALRRLPHPRRACRCSASRCSGSSACATEGHGAGGRGRQRRRTGCRSGRRPSRGRSRSVRSTRTAARADYSNFGSWVDVYALGTDLVNAYPTGTFYCHEPPNVGREARVHRAGPVERHVVLDAAGRRAHRGPDERARDQRPAGRRPAAGRGRGSRAAAASGRCCSRNADGP